MRKYTKRVLAFLLAMAMILGDAVPAMAAESTDVSETEIVSEIAEETVENNEAEEELTEEQQGELPAEEVVDVEETTEEEEVVDVEETTEAEEVVDVEETTEAESGLYGETAGMQPSKAWAILQELEDDFVLKNEEYEYDTLPSLIEALDGLAEDERIGEALYDGVLYIGYYPENDKSETPTTELGSKFFEKFSKWGVDSLLVTKHIPALGDEAALIYGWLINGIGEMEEYPGLSLQLALDKDDAAFGTGYQYTVAYDWSTVPENEGMFLAVWQDGLLREISEDNDVTAYWKTEDENGNVALEYVTAADYGEKYNMLRIWPAMNEEGIRSDGEMIFLDEYVGSVQIDTWTEDIGGMEEEFSEERLVLGWYHFEEDQREADALYDAFLTAMQSHAEAEESFGCVSIEFLDGTNNILYGGLISAASAVLGDGDGNQRIDYSFYNEKEEKSINWTLDKPYEDAWDVSAKLTLTPVSGTGVKVKFADTNFPAESVSINPWFSHNPNAGESPAFAAAFGNKTTAEDDETNVGKELRVFELSSGSPCATADCGGWYEANNLEEHGDSFNMGDVKRLTSGKEYLLAPVRDVFGDERLVVGDGYDLSQEPEVAGKKVTWKSLDERIATVDKKGIVSVLNDGEIWITAKYSGGLTIYRMNAEYQLLYMEFKEAYVEMDLYNIYSEWDPDANDGEGGDVLVYEPGEIGLDLRFYPSNMGVDVSEMKWIIETIDSETGETIEGTVVERVSGLETCFRAVNPGTAVVTAQILDENGDPIHEAVCTITVKKNDDILYDAVWPDDVYAVTNFDTTLADVHVVYNTEGDEGTEREISVFHGFAGERKYEGETWNYTWEWKNPDTKLANFKDMDGASFTAVYTLQNQDGSVVMTQETNLWVRMVSITGIEMNQLVIGEEGIIQGYTDWPEYLLKDEVLYPNYDVVLDSGEGWELDPYWYDAQGNPDGRLQAYWMSDAVKLLEKDANGNLVEDPWYTYYASSAGTKKFTISLKDTKTKKQILKKTTSVQVVKKYPTEFYYCVPVMSEDWSQSFDTSKWTGDIENLKNGQRYLAVSVNPATSYGITVKSNDTSVATVNAKGIVSSYYLDSEYPELVYFIPYTEKKPGTTVISITAKDELKTSIAYNLEVVDRNPKLTVTSAEINRAWEDPSEELSVRFNADYPLTEAGMQVGGTFKAKINGKSQTVNAADYFAIEASEGSTDSLYRGKLTVTNRSLPDGTYTIQLNGKVSTAADYESPAAALVNTDEAQEQDFILTLKVKVTSKVPTVTIKQTKNVNLFYMDSETRVGDPEGDGILTVTAAGGAEVSVLRLEDPSAKDEIRYKLVKPSEEDAQGIYRVRCSCVDEGMFNKGKVIYELPGYINLTTGSSQFEKAITIKTETKKPTLVQSAKSDTLYPKLNCGASSIDLYDKSTGEWLELTDVKYKTSWKYNPFELIWNSGEGSVQFVLNADQNIAINYGKTDKLKVSVKEANWADYVDVSYSIKVDKATAPKLKLSSSTITLNKNDAVYESQQTLVDLRLSGCSNLLYVGEGEDDRYTDVRFTGADAKSQKVLNSQNNSLVLEYWYDQGAVKVGFHDNNLAKGTYKFKVWVESGIYNSEVSVYKASATLTVKVVDVAPEKCVSVSTKGSIDVLRRNTTYLTVTPTLKNLSGQIRGARLEGDDAGRFYLDGDGVSKLYVYAWKDADFSTKNTYKVNLVLEVENDGWWYEVSKEISIKVKQGKPTVTVSYPDGNTIYRNLKNDHDAAISSILNQEYEMVGNSLEIQFKAAIGAEAVEIQDVELSSYARDFLLFPWYWWYTGTDEETGEAYDYPMLESIYNEETNSVQLVNYATTETLKNGKYTLKFLVTYTDKAGDTKAQEVKTTIYMK